MTLSIKNIIAKFLVAIIALQIINLSIDSTDFQPISSNITLGDFNYINSLTEYVSEIVLGNKDAFPEYQNESSSSKAQLVKHLSIKLSQPTTVVDIINISEELHSFIVPLNESYSFAFYKEINPPPPKA